MRPRTPHKKVSGEWRSITCSFFHPYAHAHEATHAHTRMHKQETVTRCLKDSITRSLTLSTHSPLAKQEQSYLLSTWTTLDFDKRPPASHSIPPRKSEAGGGRGPDWISLAECASCAQAALRAFSNTLWCFLSDSLTYVANVSSVDMPLSVCSPSRRDSMSWVNHKCACIGKETACCGLLSACLRSRKDSIL